MADGIPIPNAMWWVQLRLFGGFRKLIFFAMSWLALLIGTLMINWYFNADSTLPPFWDSALNILTAAQVFLLVIGGCNSIHRAMTRELQSNMIESHRLSPMSAFSIVLGYAVGPNILILMLYATGVVFGAGIIRYGTIGLNHWLAGNAYMLLVALQVWFGSVLLGLLGKKPVNPVVIIFVMGLASVLLMLVPALGVFTGAYAGIIGVALMIGNPIVPSLGMWLVLGLGIGITVLWFKAAMRKYRRPDLPAFNTPRAFGLLLIWLLLNSVPLILLHHFPDSWVNLVQSDLPQFAVMGLLSTCVTIFVTFVPLIAIAHARCRLNDARDESPRRSILPIGAAAVGCAALTLLFPGVCALMDGFPIDPKTLPASFVALALSLATAECVVTVAIIRSKQITHWLVFVVSATWLAPMILDGWMRDFTSNEDSTSVIAGFSPAGSIFELFQFADFNLVPGLVFQAILAAVALILARRALTRRRNLLTG